MEMASDEFYKPSDEELMADHHEIADTNVFSVRFSILQSPPSQVARKPIQCKNCAAVFNTGSKITDPEDETSLVNKDIRISKEDMIAQEINALWVCEFCSNHNFIKIEDLDRIVSPDCLYCISSISSETKTSVLEPKEETKEPAKSIKASTDSSVIFCIDYSGSMKQKIKLKNPLDFKENEKGMAEVLFGSYTSDLKNVRTVTRKQAVLLAACRQMQEMQIKQPDRKVGAIAFSDDVTVVGDGSKEFSVMSGPILNSFNDLLNGGKELYKEHMNKTIAENFEILIRKLALHPVGGYTALGPALTVALGLASQGNPGSSVVICTDGLATRGIGQTNGTVDLQLASDVYEKLGAFAKDNGIIVSVVTIKGEECKVDMLGKIADMTNGFVTRVSLESITNEMAKIMAYGVIATKVVLKLILHRALKFRNEDRTNLEADGSVCTKIIGNVTTRTTGSFEYEIKSVLDQQEQGIDLSGLEVIPFQAQISYELLDGSKYLRVINNAQRINNNKKEVERNARVDILATNAAQRNANLALLGRFDEAQANSAKWGAYVSKNIMSNAQKADQLMHASAFEKQNAAFASAIQQQKEKKVSGNDADDIATDMFNMKQINSDFWNQ